MAVKNHKKCQCNITLATGESNVMTMPVTTMQFFIEIMFSLKEMSYDKQNLTVLVISYGIY